jgi:hypothetical protein
MKMVGMLHFIGLLRSISKGLYYLDCRLSFRASIANVMRSCGALILFLVRPRTADSNEIKGESSICRTTS